MASLKFRHYATESDLKGTGEIQNALNAFDVGTIVFIDDTQKQYIITGKNNNVVTYKIYYGKAAIVGVTGTGATRTLTFSDGSEITITIDNVDNAEHANTADTAVSAGSATNDSNGNVIASTYLPLSGGTISGTNDAPLKINTTFTTSSIIFQNSGSNKTQVGWDNGLGAFLSNSISGYSLCVKNDGTPCFYNGKFNTLIHSGNIGSQNVNYAASSGACTGNAATATKLQTARTLWGQSFDGSGNVSGAISNTGNITPSATKTSDLGSNTLSYRYVYATWIGAPSSTELSFGAANKVHLTINTSGDVGIGTTSPTSKLHVDGTGYFTSDISSASNIIAGGYIKGETVKISSGCTLQYDSAQKCVKFVF